MKALLQKSPVELPNNMESIPISHTPNKPFPILLTSLVLLVLLLATATGFLSYRNMQLKKQIVTFQNSPTSPNPPTSPIPNKNWKTYSNKQYNFELNYPAELAYVYESITGKDEGLPLTLFRVTFQNFDGTKSKGKSDSDFQFSLSIQDDQLKTLNEYIPTNVPESSKSTITINNKEAIKIIDDHYANWPTIWTRSGGYVYIFQLSNSGQISKKYFDHILSTFKFIDQPAQQKYTCPESGWVGCMPILSEEGKRACSKEAMNWYKTNCPNFKGAAM